MNRPTNCPALSWRVVQLLICLAPTHKGCPILRMFLRRVGTTDLDLSVPLYRSSHHLRKERKDGAPSSEMAHTKDQ